MKDKQLYTVRDFAQELGLAEATVRGAIKRGEVPATKLCGKWVIDIEEARAFLRKERA